MPVTTSSSSASVREMGHGDGKPLHVFPRRLRALRRERAVEVTPSVAVALTARGVVAGVLAAAMFAKFRDPAGTRDALRAMGLPPSLDRTLPVIEAFTALGLLVERSTAWATYVACGLIAVSRCSSACS